jgi:hypothetical protein
MRRFTRRFAVACGCALAAAAFSGAAVAGNGHGNESAPGQQKQEQAASTQPASAQQAPTEQTPAQQAAAQDQAEQQAEHSPPGQEKKQEKAAASTSAEAGVKPTSTTTHWTHCTTGGAGTGGATCAAQTGTPDVSADVSKRYGNGETAAQIAVGRGAPDGTLVTGPGNSQPHKVAACGKKSNRSGGVDVHAIKSYDASACVPAASQPVTPVEQTPVQQTQQAQVASVSATVTSTASTTAPTSSASVTQGSSPTTQSAGGVLGTSKTIAKPKPAGGVLGTVSNNTVSNVAGQTLPFTGFPIWVAMLVALGLIAAGLVLRRRAAVAPV